MCSKKITGLSSRIAPLSRPFASAGVEGATIFRPGMPVSHETGICEWIAPKRAPPPTTERITSGQLCRSPVRNQYFVAWLIRLSIDSARKSPNMISSTGRLPVTAAPKAAPVIASSEIGVSNTRSGPYFSWRPGVAANTPPATATSSPKKMTRLVAGELLVERVADGVSELDLGLHGLLRQAATSATGRSSRVVRVCRKRAASAP